MERLTHEGVNHADRKEKFKEAEKEVGKAEKQVVAGQVNLAWSVPLAAYLWSLSPEAAARLGSMLPYVVAGLRCISHNIIK